jgi:uncharacterized protein (DUF488 family)
MRVYTVGHSTRSAAELVQLLRSHRVGVVVDVRRFPRSRRHPQFNIENLPGVLGDSGIGYRHLEALGGRRKRRLTADASPNTGWTIEGFRNFADYAMTPPFRQALEGLLDLARHQTAAIMCAELLWWQCHRRIISDYLLVGGFEVLHILGPGETRLAGLTRGAVPQADGAIHYPPVHAPRLER